MWFQLWQAKSNWIGWAWTTPLEAGQFDLQCRGTGIEMLPESPGGIWGAIFKPRNPSYAGAPQYFHLWSAPVGGAPRFLAWLYTALPTARFIRNQCGQLNVVWPGNGQPV